MTPSHTGGISRACQGIQGVEGRRGGTEQETRGKGET